MSEDSVDEACFLVGEGRSDISVDSRVARSKVDLRDKQRLERRTMKCVSDDGDGIQYRVLTWS